ncbi:MAG TPA: alkaline phosphatase family protein [Chthoniobacterales bacterium]|nr:alkaline phosphatase family protein [Chthoniobacterales bacterium]
MRTGRILVLGLMPLVLLMAAMFALAPEHKDTGASQARAFEPSRHFRAVVFILDSAGKSEMFDPELMPFLSSLRTSSLSGRARSCAAKATFPCIKSIFEGREATMGTTLQDFSAFASSRTTWPASLAALGTRLVVASDHTLNRLYPHAFVDSLNYEDLHAPLLERDAFVYRKARQWLDDPSIDVLVLHIIGTDKVSHEYPVRGPEYREKYREVDDFIREVTGRLEPADYLFAMSDHGHNELGGHTEDAAYLAHGPLFPNDVHQDMNAEDMLFFLSLPYGLVLPADYEGQIRMDLTRLAPDAAERWLAAQANVWRVPIAGLPMDQAQARLNEEIVLRRTDGQRRTAVETAWRSAPFLLVAALFLLGELRSWRREPRDYLFVQLTLLAVTLALAFWLFPTGLNWIHDVTHRPLAYVTFYAGSALVAYLGFRYRSVVDLLWVAGVAVWLLAYFGPLGYSLFRHGSLFVLTIFPIAAIVAAAGWRTFFSKPALFLPGLLPLVIYDVESFNLKYVVLDRIPELLLSGQLLLGALAAGIFVVALPRRKVAALFGILLWLILGRFFFQFDLVKLVGALLACGGFAGWLELFRHARLPLRWFALVSAVFFFVLLTFFLNGFALSHVDFRFAATKIFPFAKELWRAPQLIAWAMLKYAFALLPALAVVRLSAAGNQVWRQLLLLGWWRELTVAASALGLAIFNARGMRDLCQEEIYFWTFLNLIFFAGALIMATRASRADAVAAQPEVVP